MIKEYKRAQRVEPLVQEAIAKMLQQEMENPLCQKITVTNVKLSDDLSFAKVYVTTRKDEFKEEAVRFLNDHKKQFRYQIAQEIQLRRVPDFRFYYDDTISKGARIDELLKNL